MPNSRMVNEITAAIGMLRPNTNAGVKNARTRGKQPQATPIGMPMAADKEKPRNTRRREARVLRVNSFLNQSVLNRPNVSPGLGTLVPLTMRSS